MLVASGLKLLGVDTLQLSLLVLALVKLIGAPLGLGFEGALAYFGLLRPRLVAPVPATPALAEPQAPTGSGR